MVTPVSSKPSSQQLNWHLEMFDYQTNLAIVITITLFMVFPTRVENSTTCQSSCEGNPVQFPFGFSEGCEIKLNCSLGGNIEIGGLQVQKVTSSNIFINLRAKCNRSMQTIIPLLGKNFAPTRNNSLLVQNCSSAPGGCLVPATSLMGNQFKLESCDKSNGDDISCLRQLQTENDLDVLTYADVKRSGCKFLFSAIATEQGKDQAVLLQLQMLELWWWLEGDCSCSDNASCNKVRLADEKLGYRCQCAVGYIGDGFKSGTGCRRVLDCNASTFMYGGCGKIGFVVGIIAIASVLAGVPLLVVYFARRCSSHLIKQMTVEHLIRAVAGNSNLVVYPYNEIERATNFFSEQRKLGSGSFGTVYAGKLNNQWVAIKRIKYKDTNSIEQVINEIKLLSSVNHPNLVRILGCWIEEGKQILVLELMPNGTLSQHLQRKKGIVLPWKTRLTIAIETANAIAYFHSAIDPPIYHRDIKSSNILLDYNFNSKVADFGLSRLGMTNISHISTAPQGTPGYVDPEYEQRFHLSDKSDVYSFGVVLVEIITAMKVVDFARPQSEVNLAVLAVDRIGRGCMDEIMDPFLLPHADAWTNYSIHKVAELAFRCLDSRGGMRPTMMEVADELEYIKCTGSENMEETVCMASLGASHVHNSGSQK